MSKTIFNQNYVDTLKQPMFFGEDLNTSRFDRQTHSIFENLTEKQLSFFWRPEEVDLSTDRLNFQNLPTNEQHIFLSNLKYQTLLDSIQGRSPNLALLPIVSLPELETWIETWAFSETIHSRSYTHIMRNVIVNPSEVLDGVVLTEEVVKRAGSVAKYYDRLIELGAKYTLRDSSTDEEMLELRKALYLCMVSINILEGIRFYVSFACSFAFAERKLMEGNAKIIKLIARDEILHLAGTQWIIKLLKQAPEMQDIVNDPAIKQQVRDLYAEAAQEEKEWAEYLFKDGSMIGLNTQILTQYTQHLTDKRLASIGEAPMFDEPSNPLPWMSSWLSNDNVQVAPQETEISSYLTSAIDGNIEEDAFNDFSF